MSDQYVEKHEEVFRIRGTRVALDSLIYQFQIGRSPEARSAKPKNTRTRS